MNHVVTPPLPVLSATLPKTFLNSFPVVRPSELGWDVALYSFTRQDKRPMSHEDRGLLKDTFWELRRQHKDRCRGLGFIVDVDENTIAVPSAWEIPLHTAAGGYIVNSCVKKRAMAADPKSRSIVSGIIRDGIKLHFKNRNCDHLGQLWRDFDSFCQMPDMAAASRFHFCRRFSTSVKFLKNHTLTIQLHVSTATVDGHTIGDYYAKGDVEALSEMIRTKQSNRFDRQNRPAAVRLWWIPEGPAPQPTVLEIADPEAIHSHALLKPEQQKALASGVLLCREFKKEDRELRLSELRMIVDPQITQEEHSETIIPPDQRFEYTKILRDYLDGCDIFRQTLRLSEMPYDVSPFLQFIAPPPIRVKDKVYGERVLTLPGLVSPENLKDRCRTRTIHLRKQGFLQQRPMKAAFACPASFGSARANRMQSDLNYIWKHQEIQYRFEGPILYRSVEELRKAIEKGSISALFAVLPDTGDASVVHDQIKQRIQVPSQCILAKHTLPARWINKTVDELKAQDPTCHRRVRQKYQLCLDNLLVKNHWVPFAPSKPFKYNVHVGIDVGGRDNTDAMACIGYGFHSPDKNLIFRPEPIAIASGKAEPIPHTALHSGLLALFERFYEELKAAGQTPNFESCLFFKDGHLQGDGDSWNEVDGIRNLNRELLSRKWITERAVWTAVEVRKLAEGWRPLRFSGRIENPIVGQCIFPFDDERTGIVCTTGVPYLDQGTAAPLVVEIVDICGTADRTHVVSDLVWEADMCFTKTDMGMSLPWVLHVAGAGALQRSLSYFISGVTA